MLVKEGDKVLDIGCGWGGMGLYLARHLKANVTGVDLIGGTATPSPISARDEGLADRAKFELTDYRNINDKFDRLVSVGMFEHVGVGHFAEYFQHVARLMKPDGVFLLHAIGRSDGPGATNPFIRKYIFPGGYIPALSEVLPHIEKGRALCDRYRNPAASLCRNAESLAGGVPGQSRQGRRRFMMNASAACGNSIWRPPKAPSAGRT